LLENQDRSLWNREQIAEGVALLEKALKSRRFGSYTLQAAIAAVPLNRTVLQLHILAVADIPIRAFPE
jgi:predicted RNA polymerase sigma factor